MALRNTGTPAPAPAASTASSTPPFETEESGGDTAVATAPAPAPAAAPAPTAAPTPNPAAAAAAVASTAIAVAAATSGAVVPSARSAAQDFVEQVQAMKGAADFSFGNYLVYKGNNGEISCSNDGKQPSLGRWARVTMIAWEEHWEVAPNSDAKEAKGYVAYSDDGQVIRHVIDKDELGTWVGKPVQAYLDFVRRDGYPRADIRRFVDVVCAVIETDTGDMVGEVVQITLSPSSIPAFRSYQEKLVQTGKCVARGIPGFSLPPDPLTFYFVREVVKDGDKNWTKLGVMTKLPAKL